MFRLIFLPARVGIGTTKLGVKAGYRTGDLLVGKTDGTKKVGT